MGRMKLNVVLFPTFNILQLQQFSVNVSNFLNVLSLIDFDRC